MPEKKARVLPVDPPEVRKTTRPFPAELFISLLLVFLSALVGPLLLSLRLFQPGSEDLSALTYSMNSDGTPKQLLFSRSLLFTSLAGGALSLLLLTLLLLLVRPSGLKPTVGRKGKYLISYLVLILFGLLAYVVIDQLGNLAAMKPSSAPLPYEHKGTLYLALYVSGVLSGLYAVLLYKMYFEQRTLSNRFFWETLRFVIVGLIATVVDFLTTSLFQFLVFRGSTAGYVSVVSTAMGFLLGTVVNYLLSTYMVYKAAKSGFSKTVRGQLLFWLFSLLGLALSAGVYYLCYNVLGLAHGVKFFSAPVSFLIRTLANLVYSFCWRKFVVYRK